MSFSWHTYHSITDRINCSWVKDIQMKDEYAMLCLPDRVPSFLSSSKARIKEPLSVLSSGDSGRPRWHVGWRQAVCSDEESPPLCKHCGLYPSHVATGTSQ